MQFLPAFLHFCPSFHQHSVVAAQPSSVLESWHAFFVASFLVHFSEASHKVQVADHQMDAHCQEKSLIFDPCPVSINNNASKCNLEAQLLNTTSNKIKKKNSKLQANKINILQQKILDYSFRNIYDNDLMILYTLIMSSVNPSLYFRNQVLIKYIKQYYWIKLYQTEQFMKQSIEGLTPNANDNQNEQFMQQSIGGLAPSAISKSNNKDNKNGHGLKTFLCTSLCKYNCKIFPFSRTFLITLSRKEKHSFKGKFSYNIEMFFFFTIFLRFNTFLCTSLVKDIGKGKSLQ